MSTEFIIYVSLAIVMTTVIFAFVAKYLITENREDDLQIMKQTADEIANEIYLASVVEDGYFRTFDVRDNINGKQYRLNLTNKTIKLELNTYEHARFIDIETTGTVEKGTNNISKQGGVVNLNT